ncbi:type IV fimbrial biogenesis protein [Candidatus Rickettsiella viridis]|uniref:Type IV fimbrial biogenesis protein n=1 Tax=Candidatus Rickettsiella viridis TaxID=676208 RepID=A0A2Z5UXE3_9COXI|nr:type IV fimbrial biogenesis protein [Candidatus Rickettsiella viridis]
MPYELKNYTVKAIPFGNIQNNDIKSKSLLITAIKELLEKAAIYSRYCVAALPDTLVNSKWLRIDCSAAENIDVAINLAIEEHIPYPLDAMYFDYQIFDNQQEEDVSYLNVLLVACRKEHLDARLDILHQANLAPLFIEINSHAVERAYFHFYSSSTTESYMLIDVGMAQLTILFLDQTRQLRSCSERIVFSNTEAVLQQTKRFINAIFLCRPYFKWDKLFFIGSNLPVLKFLVKRLHGFLGLNTATVAWETSLFSLDSLNVKEFKKLFPSLFLSFGLALRAI